MHSWRILCNKPDGTSYLVQIRAVSAEVAAKLAVSEGHVLDTRVPPEALPAPAESTPRSEGGQVASAIAVAVALIAIVVPILSVAAVVLGGLAASESRGKRGWIGLILAIVVALVWQARQW